MFRFPALLLTLSVLLAACAGQTPLPPPTATAPTDGVILPSPTPTRIVQPGDPHPGQVEFFVALNGDDANPGTEAAPWATVNHAAYMLEAGQTVFLRGGVYALENQVVLRNSGEAGAWITFAAYPGETPILDASAIDNDVPGLFSHDFGSFTIDNKTYIRVFGLTVRNSHQMGFNVRDSQYIELYNNTVDTTYGPGIGVWDIYTGPRGSDHIKIIGNTITNTNSWDMLPKGYVRQGEPPHEAISIAGVQYFEVAYNYLYACDKEGIDIKESSKHGTVHHNFIDSLARQGLYVDAWFGYAEDIEFYANVVQRGKGAGIAVSVEQGLYLTDVRIHHNLVIDNLGTGILLSRWGEDGPRSDIRIYQNTVYHNGCGWPNVGAQYYYMTGGVYIYSSNLEDVELRGNIVAENCAFQVGYSAHWQDLDADPEAALAARRIVVDNNLVYQTEDVEYPVLAGGGRDTVRAWSFDGSHAVGGDPLFADPGQGKFWLLDGSPARDAGGPELPPDPDGSPADLGALWAGADHEMWWWADFPPVIDRSDPRIPGE